MLSTRLRMVAAASEKNPPQIVGTETARGSGTTLSAPIPEGDEGDLLLLITQRRVDSFAEPTGWHRDVSLGPSPLNFSLQAFLREADGSEGGVVTVVRSGSGTARSSEGIIYRLRGWGTPGPPNTHQSTSNSPLPTVEATAPSVVICAATRDWSFQELQAVPAGYVVASTEGRMLITISNPSVPEGFISPGSLTDSRDRPCFALTYAIPGK